VKQPRILVAGIGNVFLGDDAFGVEVVRRLAERHLPEEVRVVDFGIRGLDLAYALMDGYDLAILVDATPRGGSPGTLYVLEPEANDSADASEELIEAHGMNPMKVLRMVQSLGGVGPTVRIVGCEPATLGLEEDPAMGLSDPVKASLDGAIELIESLVRECLAELSNAASVSLCTKGA
jgi:hydrogenase maturation protease